MTKFVTPNNLIAFPSHKGNGFASPRKETTDTTPNNSAEQPKPVTITDTFLKTTLEKPISTATNTPAEVATAQQALAPLANLPTPVSQLMAGTAGNGMAPQIYVINAGGTPTPPPTIDMEVDTTTPSPLNNGGLLGMNPTTSVSLHEGVGGHHAEEHHGGGGKFNWFNSFFPFAMGGGEGVPWMQQFVSGGVVGATVAFLTNAVLHLYKQDYVRHLEVNLLKFSDDLNEFKFLGLGSLLSAILKFGITILKPNDQIVEFYDDASKRRYRFNLDKETRAVSFVDVSKSEGLVAKLNIPVEYQDFARIHSSIEHPSFWTKQAKKGNSLLNALSIPTTSPPEDRRITNLIYPVNFDTTASIKEVRIIGDYTQPKQIIVKELSPAGKQLISEQLYILDEVTKAYRLKCVDTIANGEVEKRIRATFTWVGDHHPTDITKKYTYILNNNNISSNLSDTKKALLENLSQTAGKTLNELAPFAQEMLGGLSQSPNKNILKSIANEALLLKFIPWRGMILGTLIGGLLAMKANYYEMGHKHLGIETHGGSEGSHGNHKADYWISDPRRYLSF